MRKQPVAQVVDLQINIRAVNLGSSTQLLSHLCKVAICNVYNELCWSLTLVLRT